MKRSPLPTLLGVALLILLSHSTSTLATERQRIPWTESRLIGSPDPPLPYRVVRAYEKLPLFAPVYLRPEPGTDREQPGDTATWAGRQPGRQEGLSREGNLWHGDVGNGNMLCPQAPRRA